MLDSHYSNNNDDNAMLATIDPDFVAHPEDSLTPLEIPPGLMWSHFDHCAYCKRLGELKRYTIKERFEAHIRSW